MDKPQECIVSNWQPFALLLIDVQQDFFTDELESQFPDLAKNTSKLLKFCRTNGIEVVHLRAKFQPDGSDWMRRYRLSGSIPCIQGSGGEDVCEWAEALPNEKVVTKQTFDGFLNDDLLPYLKLRDKQFLLTAGIQTSVCVLTTTLSATQLGFLATVVGDCCADEPKKHEQVLTGYGFGFETTAVADIESSHQRWMKQLRQLEKL